VARAEHVYVDFPAPNPNSTQHNRHYRYHHHRRRVIGAAGARFPFFKYLSLQQPSSSSFDDDDHAETGTGSYMDVIATSMSKRKPLAPLVGALRSVKSECEVEVMKASAEISARAHAKVSLGAHVVRRVMVFTDGARCDVKQRRCALLSLGSLKLLSKRTLSTSVRGAARSVPLMSLSLHQGRWTFVPVFCVFVLTDYLDVTGRMHSLYITPGTTIFYAMGNWCSSTPAGNTSAYTVYTT
jgi:hypothetical protein